MIGPRPLSVLAAEAEGIEAGVLAGDAEAARQAADAAEHAMAAPMRRAANGQPVGSLPYKMWPDDLRRFPREVAGVFAGGCVARGVGSRFRAKAHAHTSGKRFGWLCFLSAKRLAARELVIHELAHLLAGKGHDDRWRAKVLELGGTIDEVPGLLRSYRKRARGIPA